MSSNGNNNLILGRGQILLAECPPSGNILEAKQFEYVGNSPEFSITFETEQLEHYSSDFGLKELDESVTLQVTRSGAFTTDNINASNMAKFLLGSASALTQVAAAGVVENFAGVVKGSYLQVGRSASNPTGARGITVTSITSNPVGTTYVAGTDYRVLPETGMIEILSAGTVGASIIVTYAVVAQSRDRVISGNKVWEGALQYVETNPVGQKRTLLAPRVKLRPDGDYTLKSDEWQTLPFTLEILKPSSTIEAIYIDGQAI